MIKAHNHHYQHHFTEREVIWLEDYLIRKRPEDMGKGKVKFPRLNRLFLHMDNASQNFKNTKYIEFVTNLFNQREMDEPTTAIVIMFGCPGHRKGAWVILE